MISKKIKSKDGKGYKVIHTLRSTQRENLLTVTSRYFYEEQRFPIEEIVQACYTVLGNLGKGHGTPSTSNYVLSEENSQQFQISARQPTPQPNSAQCLLGSPSRGLFSLNQARNSRLAHHLPGISHQVAWNCVNLHRTKLSF